MKLVLRSISRLKSQASLDPASTNGEVTLSVPTRSATTEVEATPNPTRTQPAATRRCSRSSVGFRANFQKQLRHRQKSTCQPDPAGEPSRTTPRIRSRGYAARGRGFTLDSPASSRAHTAHRGAVSSRRCSRQLWPAHDDGRATSVADPAALRMPISPRSTRRTWQPVCHLSVRVCATQRAAVDHEGRRRAGRSSRITALTWSLRRHYAVTAREEPCSHVYRLPASMEGVDHRERRDGLSVNWFVRKALAPLAMYVTSIFVLHREARSFFSSRSAAVAPVTRWHFWV